MIDSPFRELIATTLREVLRDEKAAAGASAATALAPTPPEIAVSPARAGELTGYSAETILSHINAGHLRAHKPQGSREWRILVEDLRRWVAGDHAAAAPLDTKAEAAKIVANLRPAGGGRR
jgi:excisionase family DNA binding protein